MARLTRPPDKAKMAAMAENEKFAPVGESEAGLKMLRFLERRLDLPRNLLHRWLRTGQIRLNGKRCKPFENVKAGDEVRLPPFALKLAAPASPESPAPEAGLPFFLGAIGDVWAFGKPSGMLSQPDKSGEKSLSDILCDHYNGLAFKPVPAHRLDRETSGVLLVGATFQALQKLQADFRERRLVKEYLAWIRGAWPEREPVLLRHYLEDNNGIVAFREAAPGRREALCVARPLLIGPQKSLLQIRLLTGRKRQLRAQLAASGHPVIGDRRYGDKSGDGLRLHSMRAILPDGAEFSCPPPWRGDFAVAILPDPLSDISNINAS